MKKFLPALLFFFSFLLIQSNAYSQFDCNNDGICDSLPGNTGEQPGFCADCEFPDIGNSSCKGGTGGTDNCLPINAIIPEDPAPVKESAGDEACTAEELSTGLSCSEHSIDTATASTTPPAPSCWGGGGANKDVWWWFYATSQDMTFSTDAILFNLATMKDQPGFGLYDTQLALYSSADGTCNTLSELKCNDDAGINGTNVPLQVYGPPKQAVIEITGLVPGEKYWLRLDGGSNATGGNFCVSASDTYTPGSKPCEPQNIHPNNSACGDPKKGNTAVNYTSTNNIAGSTDGIQPNAYEPIGNITGVQWQCTPGLDMAQYGVWTRFEDDYSAWDGTSLTLTNLAGGERLYTLFTARTCLNLECIESFTLADGASQAITGLTKGDKYYILTTLPAGDLTQTFVTTLCLKTNTPAEHPPTQLNVGGVPGAGGGIDASKPENSYNVTLQQPYLTSTYAATADLSTTGTFGACNVGNNVFFHYELPADFECSPARLYFQMWNKNCTGGPLNGGTDMPVATCHIINDQCFDFGNPHLDGTAATEGHYDWPTNIGWEPNSYSGLYEGVFTGHQNEVCDFNFQINNSPALNGVEGKGDSVCLGEVAQICGLYATGYEWISGDPTATTVEGDLIQGNTNVCLNILVSATTNYTVVATSGADGYDVARITVFEYPEVSVNNGAICSGAVSAELTASGNAERYTWTPITNLDDPTAATVNANPSSTTVYTVTGNIGLSKYVGGFLGCDAVATSTVTVGGSIPIQVNDGVVCSGQSATLTASGGDTYTWTPATNLNQTTGQTVIASPTAPTTYTVTGEINGCFGTAEAPVTMSPTPTVTVTDASVCSGQTANIVVSGADTYLWEDGTTTTTTFTTPPITATTTFSVTGTTAAGCSETVVSTVTLSPGLSSVTVTDEEVCIGQTATLTAGGANTYEWEGGATGGTYTTPPITATSTFTVTGTDAAGCSGTAVGTVTIAAGLSISVNDVNYCPGGSGALTASGAGAGGTYAWSPATDLDAATGATVNASPAANSTYTVTGTDAGGCVGEAVATVTIDPLDDANFTFPGVTFCAPSSATASKSDAGGTGTFSISAGGPSIDGTTGFLDVPLGTAPGNYVVTYLTTTACPNTYTLTITVTANPDANFSYSGPYCLSGSTNPTITQGAGASPGNFTATPAGLVFANATSGEIDLAASAAGIYTVTNTIPAGNGCTAASATASVELSAGPVITATSTSICLGESATITASGASGTATYLWSDNTPTATLSKSPVTTTSYSVTATDNGCVSNQAVGTITVVNPPNTAVSNGAVCAGQPATVTANGADTYSWSTGESTPSITVSPSVPTTYTVTGTTSGCSSDAISSVTISASPTVTASSDNSTICAGETVTITAMGADAYQWNNLKATATITETPTTTKTYTVTGSSSAGCPGIAEITITVNPLPNVSIQLNASVCPGDSATLKATGALTYLWSDGSTADTLRDAPTSSTTYTVIGTDVNGCIGDVASNVIIVFPGPIAFPGNDTTILLKTKATLVASGGSLYSWTPDENLSCATCQVTEATPTVTTTYCVKVTDTDNCLDSACVTVTVETPCPSNEDLEVPNAFSPNNDGHNDFLVLHGWGECITEFSFVIFDRWGEKVFEGTDPAAVWDGTFKGRPLDPAVFVYFVEARFEGYKLDEVITKSGNISLIR